MSPEETYAVLLENHRRDPESLKAIADLGLFMSWYRQTMAESRHLLLRALQGARDPDLRQLILRRLVEAFGAAGEHDNAITAARALFQACPTDEDDAEAYAALIAPRGMVDEASDILGRIQTENEARAIRLMRQRGEERPTLMVADGGPLLHAFGELAYRLDLYARSRIVGVSDDFRVLVPGFAEGSYSVCNPFLLDCMRRQLAGHFEFVDDPEEWRRLETVYGRNRLKLTYYTLPDGRTLGRQDAAAAILRMWNDRPPLLRLPPEIAAKGRSWLAGLGVPTNAWFVCLHLRDGGYQAEPADSPNVSRNAAAAGYVPAIREIVRRGGWVVRIGNASPDALPPLDGVIDFTQRPAGEDWQDVFLLAASRFVIGNNSGPIAVAQVFGQPTLGTDWFPLGRYLPYPRHLLVHKLLRGRDGQFATIRESSAPAFGYSHSLRPYADAGWELRDNSPDDILAAVGDMFDLLDGRRSWNEDDPRQARYRSGCANAVCENNVMIAPSFLDAHPALLELQPPDRP